MALSEFGGEEREMEDVYKYRRGFRELRTRHSHARREDDEAGADAGTDGSGEAPGKGSGRGNNRRKPKTEQE